MRQFRNILFVFLAAFFSPLIFTIEVSADPESAAKEPDGFGMYRCDREQWIEASFFEAPVPYVALKLSDGRTMKLAQALAASGARYTNVTETVEFWSKGQEARLEEGPLGEDRKPIFDNCKEN